MIADLVAAGARLVRMVGAVPRPGLGASWDKWARYEAAVNHAYAPFPVWGLCPYDTRSAPDYVVADVLATHPYLATVDDHLSNRRCQDPAVFLAARAPGGPDPLEAAADPVVDLVGPTAAAARDAVRRAGPLASCPSTRSRTSSSQSARP
jgi:MEDS: MEthanogen/methylotroph, DcmR Sensory domain